MILSRETIDDTRIKELLNEYEQIIVIASASWCGPCQRIPITEMRELIRIPIVKIDIEECPLFSTEYNIMKLPAVMLFIKGRLVGFVEGLKSAHSYQDWIESVLQDIE